MEQKYKIVMCGCLETGWEVVRYLLASGIEISFFVTLAPEKANKLKVSGYESFRDLAEQYHIPVYQVEKYSLKSPNDIAFFRKHQFDILIQGGWQRLFPTEILETLRIGAIGIHGSPDPLPKGRGRSPINWSLIKGKNRFIIHYFLIKPGVDDGDIFYRDSFDINPWDTCRTLYYKNSIITKRAMLEWIPKLLNNNYEVYPQVGEPTYYPKRTPEDGLINWENDVIDIYNFIRALTHPYPGAFSYVNNEKVSIWTAQPFDTRIIYNNKKYGEIVEIFKTGDVIVNCSGGLLLIKDYEAKKNLNRGDCFKG